MSLERDFTNKGGQVSWSDKYVTFGTYSYTQAVSLSGGVPADIGLSNTNFYRTATLYDDRGRTTRAAAAT